MRDLQPRMPRERARRAEELDARVFEAPRAQHELRARAARRGREPLHHRLVTCRLAAHRRRMLGVALRAR